LSTALTDGPAGPRLLMAAENAVSGGNIAIAAVPDALNASSFLTDVAVIVPARDIGLSGPDTLGESMRRINDPDGDGIPEIAISTVGENVSGVDVGVISVSMPDINPGSPGPPVVPPSVHIVPKTKWGTPANANGFGFAFASIDSVIGDARPDLAIG